MHNNIDIIFYDLCRKAKESKGVEIANQRANNDQIKCIIAHAIGMELVDIIPSFINLNVSSHYFIPQITAIELQKLMPKEFGHITFNFPNRVPVIQFVADEMRAWHAGESYFGKFNRLPNCQKGLNSCSIGIEFHAPGYGADGHDFYRFTPFDRAQKDTSIYLIKYLMSKYAIPSQNLLAHSTIAPDRKTDPGPLFFWQELYEYGIGYLPSINTHNHDITKFPQGEKELFIIEQLRIIGFNNKTPDQKAISFESITRAYMMQFAPHLLDKELKYSIDELAQNIMNFDSTIY